MTDWITTTKTTIINILKIALNILSIPIKFIVNLPTWIKTIFIILTIALTILIIKTIIKEKEKWKYIQT